MQEATGHEDPVEEMVKYLTATSKEPEPDKIRAYCEGSVEHFGWLEALGFEFERSYYPEKAVIQPGTQGLMFTGNEKVWPYLDQARPAPRGHKVPVPGDIDGTKMVMDLLRDQVEEAGVEVRYETGVTNLVTGAAGAVVGVAWRSFDETGVVRADAVVLAAGGFVMNPDMVAAHTPALGSKLFTLGSTYDDGLGIRLGASVGGELKHMDEPFITAPFYPPSVLVKGLVVNKRGERFVAEDSYHARTSYHVMQQPDAGRVPHRRQRAPGGAADVAVPADRRLGDGRGDGGGPRPARRARWSPRWTATTSTPPAARTRTSTSTPTGWPRRTSGPWGAYDLTLGKALYAGFTLGGSARRSTARSSAPDGSVVDGLYAAGACASNIAQDGSRLLLRHPARRGLVLRPAGGAARGSSFTGYPVKLTLPVGRSTTAA